MGITAHAGQGCSLLTRTLVHESVHDELVARLTAALARLAGGFNFWDGTRPTRRPPWAR
ncbi:aldehyde dehydrogenase family protein [Streptomyces sp. NPDC005921]